jgi:hypothetical protein
MEVRLYLCATGTGLACLSQVGREQGGSATGRSGIEDAGSYVLSYVD